MQRWLAFPFSILFYFFFGVTLCLFLPIQIFALRILGIGAQKKTVDVLNWLLLRYLNLLGVVVNFSGPKEFPKGTLAFVANHQSTYDIPPLIWYLRNHYPKFIAKKELGKGIPSISYHLNNGGNVLINRKDPKQAKKAIVEFCKKVVRNNWSIVIFAEGTRSRNGEPKKFQRGGLRTLLSEIPDLHLVPVSISHSWKLSRWNYFPMPIGIRIIVQVHSAVPPHNDHDRLIDRVEKVVYSGIRN